MSSVSEEQECPILLELLEHQKTDSENGIISCLTRLQTKLLCREFMWNEGLGVLVKLLPNRNLKILDGCLTILRWATYISRGREEVRGTKIANYLVSIIKNAELGNELHRDACRLIGNLAECSWHAETLYSTNAIPALIDLLNLNHYKNIRITGIRAIRNIWIMHEGSREEIVESGIIKWITALLVSSKEKSETEAKYCELVEACLKAICAFLVMMDPRCGEQIRGEKDLEGFKCIVKISYNCYILAIMSLHRLCHIAEFRPILGDVGAIECLITVIKEQSEICKETVISLCLFCREAVNRARIRIGAGLELLLSLLKNPEHERYHPTLLHALAQFIYDDQSILIMVKHGLLDILVIKLNTMVAEVIGNKEKKISKKRSFESPPYRQSELKFNKTSYGRFSLDYPHYDWSPGCATSISSSPPSTPLLPFYNFIHRYNDTECDYSPVREYSSACIEMEFNDYEYESQEEVESLESCKSLTAEAEDSRDSEKPSKSNCNEYANAWTLVLLSRLSHSNDPIERLADPRTIEALSAYIRYTKNPRASRILTRIVRNGTYLITLLKQGFVFEAQTLYGSEQYTIQLSALAETNGAIGELSSILIHGEENHKLIIAVSIPYLIRCRFILKSLLYNYGGLQLIFLVLNDQESSLYEHAIASVCRLASTLQIQQKLVEENSTRKKVEKKKKKREKFRRETVSTDFPKVYDNHPKPATVTFELDDGTTVDACRQTLCQKSDAFSAMLEGNFFESGKKRVKLRNASKEGLHTLLLAANGATFENRSIESLLDAVLLADKFLMADICDTLTESSISKLNYTNFSRAWHWAKINSCYELKSCCVKKFFTARMTRPERIQAFRDFSMKETFQEFLKELKEIINGVLCKR